MYWVYIMASGPRGILYIGMTSDLANRALEHRQRLLDGFTKRYNVDRLVYFEAHDEAEMAARRERAMIGGATGRSSLSKRPIRRGGISSTTCYAKQASSHEPVTRRSEATPALRSPRQLRDRSGRGRKTIGKHKPDVRDGSLA